MFVASRSHAHCNSRIRQHVTATEGSVSSSRPHEMLSSSCSDCTGQPCQHRPHHSESQFPLSAEVKRWKFQQCWNSGQKWWNTRLETNLCWRHAVFLAQRVKNSEMQVLRSSQMGMPWHLQCCICWKHEAAQVAGNVLCHELVVRIGMQYCMAFIPCKGGCKPHRTA